MHERQDTGISGLSAAQRWVRNALFETKDWAAVSTCAVSALASYEAAKYRQDGHLTLALTGILWALVSIWLADCDKSWDGRTSITNTLHAKWASLRALPKSALKACAVFLASYVLVTASECFV